MVDKKSLPKLSQRSYGLYVAGPIENTGYPNGLLIWKVIKMTSQGRFNSFTDLLFTLGFH